jgi:hypothetical protein
MPDVFLTQSPEINAFATGFLGRKKTVVLHSALVEAMTWDEWVYIRLAVPIYPSRHAVSLDASMGMFTLHPFTPERRIRLLPLLV